MAAVKKNWKEGERNFFNMQWQDEAEKKEFIKEAEKMKIKKMAEYIRAIHREHKDKSKSNG